MKKTIVLRIPEDLAETLRLSALGERRSVNQQATHLLERALVLDGWIQPFSTRTKPRIVR